MNLISVTGNSFYLAVERAKSTKEIYRQNLSNYSVDELNKFRCFLSLDGLTGFCLKKDGELINVFSLIRGRGKYILFNAFRENNAQAIKLDCLKGYLSEFYASFGFRIYKIEKNWEKNQPDVVYMIKR